MSIKVVIQGAAGRMGKTLIRCILEEKVAGLPPPGGPHPSGVPGL